jgi:hypothetical protein
MAGVVDPATTTTFTMQMDCIFAELDLINRQLDISDHLISEMERWVSFLPRSVPLLSPPCVASPLPPNARAALPSPSPNVAAHHLLGRFPASDTALASDGQRPRAPTSHDASSSIRSMGSVTATRRLLATCCISARHCSMHHGDTAEGPKMATRGG